MFDWFFTFLSYCFPTNSNLYGRWTIRRQITFTHTHFEVTLISTMTMKFKVLVSPFDKISNWKHARHNGPSTQISYIEHNCSCSFDLLSLKHIQHLSQDINIFGELAVTFGRGKCLGSYFPPMLGLYVEFVVWQVLFLYI